MVNYYPKTLSEALSVLSEKKVRPMAGGTDLMVRHRSIAGVLPELSSEMLFLNGLSELKKITVSDNSLVIGAGVTLEEIRVHEKTPEIFKEILGLMASFAIRHEGTLAGNIGNASPAADSLPFLYISDARITVQSVEGEEEIPLCEYISGPGKTVRNDNQLITRITVPLIPHSTYSYKKVGGRRSDAISKLSFAAIAKHEEGVLQDVRVAFGSVAPTVIRDRGLEENLIDALNSKSSVKIDEIVEAYNSLIVPIDDQRSTAGYRKRCSLNLLQSFIGSLHNE